MSEYWFARRHPLESARNAMAPVHWKGWALVAAFVGLDLAGAAAFVLLALAGDWTSGLVAFVALASLGASGLIYFVLKKADPARTIRDYQGRGGERTNGSAL